MSPAPESPSTVRSGLAAIGGDATPVGRGAGHVNATAVVAAARPRGVRLADLGRYHVNSQYTGNGLVLGYGNLADGAVAQAVAELTAAVRESFR